MKNKLLYVIYAISLFSIPFLNKAQSPILTHQFHSFGPLGLNNPPVAGDDFITMCQEGGTVTIAVQANDNEPDGDMMMTTVISGPSNGTATVAGGTDVEYTPNFGFYGTDIISYVVCDNGIPSMCDTATIIINVTQAPVADCGPDQTICFGDVTTIGTPAMAGNLYMWTPAAGLSSVTAAQPSCSPTAASTTYTLTVNSMITGCSNTDMVTITVNPVPPADAGPDHTLCEKDSVQLGTPGTFGNTYYWTPIAPLSDNSDDQPMASPDTTTTFLLVVTTTATGCYSTDSVVVNIIPGPPTDAGPNKTICPGQSVVIGTPAVAGNTYSWSPAIGLSSTTTAQPTANPAVTTTYILTVTNTSTGCTDSDSVTVTVNPPPLALTGPDRVICAGDSVMLGAPPIPGNTYSWTPTAGLSNPNAANPWASPAVTTTYTLTETAGVGCSATNSVTVTVIPGAIADAGADVTICTGATTVIGTPSVSGVIYVWTPILGLSSTVIAQPTASPDSTTTYILVATNLTTGCTSTDSVTVTVVSPPTADAGPDQTICNGDSVIIGTPAVAGETYSWSPSTGLSSSTVAQPAASPSATTTYTLMVSNAGCSDSDNVTVTVNALPAADAGADMTICPGQDVTLGTPGVSGNTYSWSPATGLSSSTVAQPTAAPDSTTTYILTVTSSSTSCTNNDTVVITVNPSANADAGADVTICNGNSAVIGSPAVASFTYNWSPATGLSSSTIAQPTASPAVTTTYIVTMTNDTTSCENSDTVTVTVAPSPAAFTGPDQTICMGDSVTLGGTATAGHTYSWSPATGLSSTSVSNPTASPDSTTTYTLVESIGTGCVDSNTVTITVIDPVTADAGADQTTCAGSSVTIGTTAVAGMTYNWSPATGLSSSTVAQPTASPSATTTYILTVTDTASGCQETDTVMVTIDPLPLASTGPDQTICAGDSVTLGAAPVTGNTYSWSPATGLSSSTIANPTASPGTTTTYTLTESAGPGCVSSNTVTITVLDPPVADAGADQTTCNGGSVTIGTTAVTGMSYNWSPSGGLSSTTEAQPIANPTVTTTYVLTVTNTATGCSATDTVMVNVNDLEVDAGADVSVCAGDSVMIGGTSSAGSTYSWSPATGLSASTIANPYASPTATTVYILTETDSAGCTGTDTVTVTVNSGFTADAGPDMTICAGSSTMIGTTPVASHTYNWSPATGLSSTTTAQPDASPGTTTTYVVTVENTTTGCSDTDSMTVFVNPLPLADAGADQFLCSHDTVTIGSSAVAGYTYSWSPSDGLSSSTVSDPVAHPEETTTYVVSVSDGTCTSTDTVVVTINTFPLRLAGDDQVLCTGGTVLLGAAGNAGYTYEWSPATNLSSTSVAQPVCSATENTMYSLTVTDGTTGCTTRDSVFVTVQDAGIYNGISPNGDGVNDDWTIPMLDCYTSNTVTILNRWGAEVWKASDYNNADIKWNGKNLDGEDLPDGTYYYVIAYNDTEKRGWVFLKR